MAVLEEGVHVLPAIHVLPVDDLVEHELSEGCVCGPWLGIEEDFPVVIHHALDGRE